MLRNRAKRKYGTVAQEIQFSEFYRTAIIVNEFLIFIAVCKFYGCAHQCFLAEIPIFVVRKDVHAAVVRQL